MTTRWTITREVKRMSMTTFILIVGMVLLTLAAINEAIVLLNRLYEQDQRHKANKRGE